MISAARIHIIAGVTVCLVLPAASYLDGTGRLAYTMFAKTAEHRIAITITLDDGTALDVPATTLASRAGTTAGTFLAGAERFVPGPVHRTPREQLGPLADLACRHVHAENRNPRSARVELVERDDNRFPERHFVAERSCRGQ